MNVKIKDYLEAEKRDGDLAEDTLATRETILNQMDEWFLENLDKPISEIDVKDAIRYFEDELQPRWRSDEENQVVRDDQGRFKKIVKGGISTDTARIHLKALQAFLDEKLGRMEKQEQDFDRWFEDMRDDLPGSDYEDELARNDRPTFTHDEIQQLREVAGFKYKLIYDLMFDSGRRPREVAMLRVDRIDFENNRIEYDILKKNRPTTEWVDIDPEVMDMLERYVQHRVSEDDEYVFASNSKRGFLTVSSIRKTFKDHAEKAGIELGDRSLKSFRHTYVTYRISQGDTYEEISKTATHNTTRVLEKSYAGNPGSSSARSGLEMIRDE